MIAAPPAPRLLHAASQSGDPSGESGPGLFPEPPPGPSGRCGGRRLLLALQSDRGHLERGDPLPGLFQFGLKPTDLLGARGGAAGRFYGRGVSTVYRLLRRRLEEFDRLLGLLELCLSVFPLRTKEPCLPSDLPVLLLEATH
jgi:hypothetical protein